MDTERRYGRTGQYTAEEWQGVIAEQRHKSTVSRRFQPQKDAIMRQVAERLAAIGVTADKIPAVAKLLANDRLWRVQWSSAAMQQAVRTIQAWYDEQMGQIAIEQIEADNDIHVWGN